MPAFDSHDGVSINYIEEGSGPAIVLVHGFASSLHGNWRAPGFVDALVAAGRRVVALDCRGHGRSGKPHDPDAYGGTKMPDDVTALMDHLEIPIADLMGYSMGGIISAQLLVHHQERFRSAIIAGIGDAVMSEAWRERRAQIARAFEDGGDVPTPTAKAFRAFAEASGNDLQAMGAIQRSPRQRFESERLREVHIPVLVVIGEADTLAGKADGLAATIPGARLVTVPGDHLGAVAAPEYKRAALEFLSQHSPVK